MHNNTPKKNILFFIITFFGTISFTETNTMRRVRPSRRRIHPRRRPQTRVYSASDMEYIPLQQASRLPSGKWISHNDLRGLVNRFKQAANMHPDKRNGVYHPDGRVYIAPDLDAQRIYNEYLYGAQITRNITNVQGRRQELKETILPGNLRHPLTREYFRLSSLSNLPPYLMMPSPEKIQIAQTTLRDELPRRILLSTRADLPVIEETIRTNPSRPYYLSLVGNNISKEELGHILKIAHNQIVGLSLHNTHMSTLPHSVGKLLNLKELNLTRNAITHLPDSIGNLFNLEKIDLRNNHITKLPETVGNLINLQELLLGSNPLTQLPNSIGYLEKLEKLSANNAQLSSLPENIVNLVRLDELLLGNNKLTHLPEDIGDLQKLIQLDLKNNRQLTTLPASMSNLRNLQHLELQNTSINPKQQAVIRQQLPNAHIYF